MTHERTGDSAACLGVGSYGVQVVARKTNQHGAGMVGDLENVQSGNWGRGLDTISSASVTVGLTPGCCETLNKVEVLRHELEIFRGHELVWCGPITELSVDEDAETATLAANDLSMWFNLRAFRHTMQPKGIDLARIFEGYANYALGRGLPEWGKFFMGDKTRPMNPPVYTDDFGLKLHVTDTGVTGDRTVYFGELKVVYTELEELAQTGVDWTVLCRDMFVGGEISDTDDGDSLQLPGRLGDDDFVTPPRLRMTSEGMASEVLTRANGVRSRVGGPYDDGIEITRVLDEYSIEDQTSADAAAQSYFDRGKEALVYVEGQGQLAPDCPLSVQQLVPGSRVRAVFEGGGCMNLAAGLRLDNVNASWDGDGESIMPTLQPLGAHGADARGVGG